MVVVVVVDAAVDGSHNDAMAIRYSHRVSVVLFLVVVAVPNTSAPLRNVYIYIYIYIYIL